MPLCLEYRALDRRALDTDYAILLLNPTGRQRGLKHGLERFGGIKNIYRSHQMRSVCASVYRSLHH